MKYLSTKGQKLNDKTLLLREVIKNKAVTDAQSRTFTGKHALTGETAGGVGAAAWAGVRARGPAGGHRGGVAGKG